MKATIKASYEDKSRVFEDKELFDIGRAFGATIEAITNALIDNSEDKAVIKIDNCTFKIEIELGEND